MTRFVPVRRWKRVGCLPFVRAGAAALLAGLIAAAPEAGNAGSSTNITVLTYHYDNWRTGWNWHETVLNAANVNNSSFGLLYSVAVDGVVAAQPLVVRAPEHDSQPVVIVATENNIIYYINPATGTVVLSRNLGTPVPRSAIPGHCNENGPAVGISSTPVIDPASRTLYVVTYTMENGAPVYRIHALDLATLNDKVGSGGVISASQTLSNGTVYDFTPATSRQRAALLAANGNIYAGFASFCDLGRSRGWLLGWQTGTLDPMPANQLNDQFATSPSSKFLSSIWMSGAGIATDLGGHLYLCHRQFRCSELRASRRYSGERRRNVSQPDGTNSGLFTPNGGLGDEGQPYLDMQDRDFGAGGVLIVPEQGSLPLSHLAAAAGKDGYLYLLNRERLRRGQQQPQGRTDASPRRLLVCGVVFRRAQWDRARRRQYGEDGHRL